MAKEISRHEISNVLGNVTTCDIYGIQVYSRFDIVNSTMTFPVHFHTDFWSGNIIFFPVHATGHFVHENPMKKKVQHVKSEFSLGDEMKFYFHSILIGMENLMKNYH